VVREDRRDAHADMKQVPAEVEQALAPGELDLAPTPSKRARPLREGLRGAPVQPGQHQQLAA
jgi:hypothetical protein